MLPWPQAGNFAGFGESICPRVLSSLSLDPIRWLSGIRTSNTCRVPTRPILPSLAAISVLRIDQLERSPGPDRVVLSPGRFGGRTRVGGEHQDGGATLFAHHRSVVSSIVVGSAPR